jgi:hypothetical protein
MQTQTLKETDWTAYRRQVERQKPAILAAMKSFAQALGIPASEVWDDDCDDFNVAFLVSRDDGERLDAKFSIWDSGDADDGVYGEHGNFIFDLVEEGGRIVGQCVPENYSDNVWVDYSDDDEWDFRREAIVRGFDAAKRIVNEWRAE